MADMIVVMENGKISEKGTYEKLLEENGRFAEFIRTYLNQEAAELESDAEGLLLC